MLLLLAIALTVMAGPLGRPSPDQTSSDDVVRSVTVTPFTAVGPVR